MQGYKVVSQSVLNVLQTPNLNSSKHTGGTPNVLLLITETLNLQIIISLKTHSVK